MKSDDHLVRFDHLSTIVLDRGYVSETVVDMLSAASLHLVGTQKKGKGCLFSIDGDGSNSKQKTIDERGIMAEFWARKKQKNGARTHHLAIREERVHRKGQWNYKTNAAGAQTDQ